MTKLKALAVIVIPCPSGQFDVVGFRDDGAPISREREMNVQPGELFEIESAHVAASLIDGGFATDDLQFAQLWPSREDGEATDGFF